MSINPVSQTKKDTSVFQETKESVKLIYSGFSQYILCCAEFCSNRIVCPSNYSFRNGSREIKEGCIRFFPILIGGSIGVLFATSVWQKYAAV